MLWKAGRGYCIVYMKNLEIALVSCQMITVWVIIVLIQVIVLWGSCLQWRLPRQESLQVRRMMTRTLCLRQRLVVQGGGCHFTHNLFPSFPSLLLLRTVIRFLLLQELHRRVTTDVLILLQALLHQLHNLRIVITFPSSDRYCYQHWGTMLTETRIWGVAKEPGIQLFGQIPTSQGHDLWKSASYVTKQGDPSVSSDCTSERTPKKFDGWQVSDFIDMPFKNEPLSWTKLWAKYKRGGFKLKHRLLNEGRYTDHRPDSDASNGEPLSPVVSWSPYPGLQGS